MEDVGWCWAPHRVRGRGCPWHWAAGWGGRGCHPSESWGARGGAAGPGLLGSPPRRAPSGGAAVMGMKEPGWGHRGDPGHGAARVAWGWGQLGGVLRDSSGDPQCSLRAPREGADSPMVVWGQFWGAEAAGGLRPAQPSPLCLLRGGRGLPKASRCPGAHRVPPQPLLRGGPGPPWGFWEELGGQGTACSSRSSSRRAGLRPPSERLAVPLASRSSGRDLTGWAQRRRLSVSTGQGPRVAFRGQPFPPCPSHRPKEARRRRGKLSLAAACPETRFGALALGRPGPVAANFDARCVRRWWCRCRGSRSPD